MSWGCCRKVLRRVSAWCEQGRRAPPSLKQRGKARQRSGSGLPGSAADGLLDVHRRRCKPQLDLDAASSFETRPSQPMQFFGQAEGSFYIGLPLDEPPFAQRARDPFLRRLHQVQRPRAVQRARDPRRSAVRAERTGKAAALGRLIAHALRPLHVGVSPQMLAGGTEKGVLVRQPLEVLAPPDARVLVAEAGGGNEGGDAGVATPRRAPGRGS